MVSVYIRLPRYAEVIFERIYTLAAFKGLRAPYGPVLYIIIGAYERCVHALLIIIMYTISLLLQPQNVSPLQRVTAITEVAL